MKVSVKKQELAEALHKVSSIIGGRSTLPILTNALLECEDNKLTVTTTDLEIRITSSLEALIEKTGKITLPVKIFRDIVTKFKGDTVSIESEDNYHTTIQSGNAIFKINGISPEDFPLPVTFTPIRRLKVPKNLLSRSLNRISYAVNPEENRKFLRGVLFSIKEGMFTTVATDAKRLALVETNIENYETSGEDGDAIVPIKSVLELKNLSKGEEVIMEIGENQALFRCGNTVMSTKLLEGVYPNYKQVVPLSFSKKVHVAVSDFVSSLDIVTTALEDYSCNVKLTFTSDKLKLEAVSMEIGEAVDFFEINYDYPEDVVVSFNWRYLREPFQNIDSKEVIFKMNDEFSAVALETDDGFLYVIMPIRKS